MEIKNNLEIKTRKDFRDWLVKNHNKETECWFAVKKGKMKSDHVIWYLDSVEEALCFGWIDTTNKNINGINLQKFTPRRVKSIWSELNKERCRRLEKLGLMTDFGRKALPDMSGNDFVIDNDIIQAFEKNRIAYEHFKQFPLLYQKVRIDTIQREKKDETFWKRLQKLIDYSANNQMFGDWNDYGLLLNY